MFGALVRTAALGLLGTSLAASGLDAQVLTEQRISASSGGFTGSLPSGSQFGRATASLGDFDGDGVGDVAVGSMAGGPLGNGSVWLLFLNPDGTVTEPGGSWLRLVSFGGSLAERRRHPRRLGRRWCV
jgi:hypothetical protein